MPSAALVILAVVQMTIQPTRLDPPACVAERKPVQRRIGQGQAARAGEGLSGGQAVHQVQHAAVGHDQQIAVAPITRLTRAQRVI